MAGFEPAASTSQTWRDNRATLHPDGVNYNISNYKSQITEICKRRGAIPGGVYAVLDTVLHPEIVINIFLAWIGLTLPAAGRFVDPFYHTVQIELEEYLWHI